MERRVFIAVLLSFAVLYGYQALFVPATKSTPPGSAASGDTAGAPAAQSGTPASQATTAESSASQPAAAEAVVGENAPREIVVETRDAEIVLTNQGARVVHWRLKGYKDPKGAPVDLVPSDLPATEVTPFSLRVPDPAISRATT